MAFWSLRCTKPQRPREPIVVHFLHHSDLNIKLSLASLVSTMPTFRRLCVSGCANFGFSFPTILRPNSRLESRFDCDGKNWIDNSGQYLRLALPTLKLTQYRLLLGITPGKGPIARRQSSLDLRQKPCRVHAPE